MSFFRTSKQSSENVVDKILFYGPQFTGKTHTSLTWPKVALVDVETRAAHFAGRVDFMHAEPTTIEEIGQVFKEVRAGRIDCETVIVDSYSAIYEKLVVQHTKGTEQGKYVTDYVTVNKRIAGCRDFAFGMAGKNIIFIAHAIEKYARDGNNFTKRGVDILGQESFRYAFDYIFRLEPTGNDPRVSPPKFIVEKSASVNLKIGQQIVGLNYAKFRELTNPKPQSVPAPASVPATAAQRVEALPTGILQLLGSVSESDRRKIVTLAEGMKMPSQRLGLLIASITGDMSEALAPNEVASLVDTMRAEAVLA